MKLQTRYFGEVDYEESEVITFPDGMPGFPEEQRYLLLPFAGGENKMLCLQSLTTLDLAFVLLDPFTFCPEYHPTLEAAELQQMGVSDAEELFFYVLCVLRNPIGESTVNLRCPVVINPHTLMARQIIMGTETYGMRHPLSEFEAKRGGAVC